MSGFPQVGLSLPNRAVLFGAMTIDQMLETAKAVDRSPYFHSIWVGDSLIAKPRLEAIVLLSALAAQTRRVKLGPACMASFNLRHPIVFAAQWATLDLLSAGRTVLCVCLGGPTGPGSGAGDFEVELRAMGVSLKERVSRMEEGMTILRKLWSEDRVSHHGRYYQFEDVRIEPKPTQTRVPIWIASSPNPDLLGPVRFRRALARVARLADGWMTALVSPDEFGRRWRFIQECAVKEGRDPNALDSSQHIMVNIGSDEHKAQAEAKRFLDAYYTANFSEEELSRWGVFGSAERVAERLLSFIEAGCKLPIIRLATWDPLGQLRSCVEEVLPRLNSGPRRGTLLGRATL